jgi:hypothetical protein
MGDKTYGKNKMLIFFFLLLDKFLKKLIMSNWPLETRVILLDSIIV